MRLGGANQPSACSVIAEAADMVGSQIKEGNAVTITVTVTGPKPFYSVVVFLDVNQNGRFNPKKDIEVLDARGEGAATNVLENLAPGRYQVKVTLEGGKNRAKCSTVFDNRP